MKRLTLILAGAAVLVIAGGLAVAWSGIYNVAASAGHWAITAWFLRFTMENSVETYSGSIEVPPLDEAARIERGAGHYETGCAPCHGAPGIAGNVIARELLPPPSFLGSVLPWSDEELFWIIKHGLKYSAMPPWPAQDRDDEVWAMVAFVRQLPEMTPQEYAALAKGAGAQVPASAGEAEPPLPEAPGELFAMTDAALLGACVRCHGADGAGRPSGAFPRLDMQTPDYLARALDEYASGVRASGIMQPVAAALEPAQIGRVAGHYAEAAGPLRTSAEAAPEAIALGRRIATEGIADKDVPACATCHGLEEGPQNRLFPALNGQFAAYTLPQLQLWQEGKRGGGAYSEIMRAVARNMSQDEMQAVARFYESLPATRTGVAAGPARPTP